MFQEKKLESGKNPMPTDNIKVEDIQIQGESLVDDIFGVQDYALESRPRKEFLPWHRPRKQFVRQYQWLEQIKNMVDEIMPENNVLKYLGLPGDDLLDLRYFHDHLCVPKSLRLKFLGFNRSASTLEAHKADLNISLDEVRKLQNVDPTSLIIGDDICQIARGNSLALKRSEAYGPFDVINIDLCDGFCNQPINEFKETHYNTMNQLMALQARRPKPWLLFITTRTGLGHIDDEVLTRLKALYNQNLIDCPSFNSESIEKFDIGTEEDLNSKITNSKSLSDIFLISLCKWIASIADSQNPPVRVELKSVLGYKISNDSQHQDLVSFALKIIPTILTVDDNIGLTSTSTNQTSPGKYECSSAVQILKRVAKLVDVDGVLINDGELMNKMIENTSILLDQARYDLEGFDNWARS